MADVAYDGVIVETLRLKGAEVLLDTRKFCACLVDLADPSFQRDIKAIKRNVDDSMLRLLFEASRANVAQMRLARGKLMAQLVDEALLSEDVATRLADALADGVCRFTFGCPLEAPQAEPVSIPVQKAASASDSKKLSAASDKHESSKPVTASVKPAGAPKGPAASPKDPAVVPKKSAVTPKEPAVAPKNPVASLSKPASTTKTSKKPAVASIDYSDGIVNPLAKTVLGGNPYVFGTTVSDRLSHIPWELKEQFASLQGRHVFLDSCAKLNFTFSVDNPRIASWYDLWPEVLNQASKRPLPRNDNDSSASRQQFWVDRLLCLCMAKNMYPDETLDPAEQERLEADPIAWWIAKGDAVPDTYLDGAITTTSMYNTYNDLEKRTGPYHRAACLGSARALGKMAFEYMRLGNKLLDNEVLIDSGTGNRADRRMHAFGSVKLSNMPQWLRRALHGSGMSPSAASSISIGTMMGESVIMQPPVRRSLR